MKWSEHVRALSRLSSGSPLTCSPVLCPSNQWPYFQHPLSSLFASPHLHIGNIFAFASFWLFKIQYAACQDWPWGPSLVLQTWGRGCAAMGEDPQFARAAPAPGEPSWGGSWRGMQKSGDIAYCWVWRCAERQPVCSLLPAKLFLDRYGLHF